MSVKKGNTVRPRLPASVVGAVTILLVTMLGCGVGGQIEARIGRPVVTFEMAPFFVWFFGTPPGMLVAIAGAMSGTWWRGLGIGLLVHGLFFGWLAWMATVPVEVSCWMFVVGTIGGGAAGAMGGRRA